MSWFQLRLRLYPQKRPGQPHHALPNSTTSRVLESTVLLNNYMPCGPHNRFPCKHFLRDMEVLKEYYCQVEENFHKTEVQSN